MGTAKFCMIINDFVDCSNVRSMTEHISKRNQLIKPYAPQDDQRFRWLKNVFLDYLGNWKNHFATKEGKYPSNHQEKMFITTQIYEGLKISVYSNIEVIIFLLAQGFQHALSARFMQDVVVEDNFCHQNVKGGRSDNPTAKQFGYNALPLQHKTIQKGSLYKREMMYNQRRTSA